MSRRPASVERDDSTLRVSQRERDDVVERLRHHAGEGRLELDELEHRVEAALGARTRADLDRLLADLPGSHPRPARPRRGTPARLGLLPLLAAVAILVLAPHGVAWVGWVVLGWWLLAGCTHPGRRHQRSVTV